MMCGPVRDIPGGPVRKVVVAGGFVWGYLSTVDIYDIARNKWTTGMINSLIKRFLFNWSLSSK